MWFQASIEGSHYARTVAGTPKGCVMHVRLGARVLDKNKIEVGQVDRLVINPETRQIVQLVDTQGLLRQKEVIIDREVASYVGADGSVYLNITEQEVNQLREFLAIDYAPRNASNEFSRGRCLRTAGRSAHNRH